MSQKILLPVQYSGRFSFSSITPDYQYGTTHLRHRHFFWGGGVKNLPNLLTVSSKKTADVSGVGVKNRKKFADVLNGWSLSILNLKYNA